MPFVQRSFRGIARCRDDKNDLRSAKLLRYWYKPRGGGGFHEAGDIAMPKSVKTLDANEAVANVAFLASEVIAIYPITPSSPMGEWADQWMAEHKRNIWDSVPHVMEMQSEAGVAGALHGALQTGALATTFTASQGLLLVIPNMFKIAGELTPCVIHVAARTIATHALSIFGDHSDVMAARATGFAMLCSNSVQECMDLALVAHAATLEARLPFMHFFDGFRTSHEVGKIEMINADHVRAMLKEEHIQAHRRHALSPERPVLRGTAQNPDVYFQAREAVNSYYNACPTIVQNTMDELAKLTGRQYHLFDYEGDPQAERVIIVMGSGAETVAETASVLNKAGERVGVLKVRLYRPFSVEHFVQALPATVKSIAVLDRTKEPGATGEPLYQDVITALAETIAAGAAPMKTMPRVIGGRYGLSSKEFTPAMVKAVYDELLSASPRNHFTVGIIDDVTHTSLPVDYGYDIEDPDTVRAVFYGLGSDGTVGANKNSIKIIGEDTPNYAQGYFVYDSKKSGSITVSHLRFGPKPIRAPYLIRRANFIAVHQFFMLEQHDVLKHAVNGAAFLLNSPYGPDEVWDHLPRIVQEHIIKKKLRFYIIDGYKVGAESGMGRRINTVMQTCFFAISGVLPREEAIAAIKHAVEKTYGKRGEAIVRKNHEAIDNTLAHLYGVNVPAQVTSELALRLPIPAEAPEFLQRVTAEIIAGRGDELPVSALPVDGTFPTNTAKWEKRAIAQEIPVWEPDLCIQCGKCVLVCPHSVIRGKIYGEDLVASAPAGFKSTPARLKEFKGQAFTLQVAAEDCTGCKLCVEVCPVKDKREVRRKAINMQPFAPLRAQESANWSHFEKLPGPDRSLLHYAHVKEVTLLPPLFEFSGACAGCGETPYLRLMSSLFGDRAHIANATGCSSIYGGNLPTTPWATNAEGRGPAWANSLFEDNAEFGLGMRLALDKQTEYARELLQRLGTKFGDALVDAILTADQSTDAGIAAQRARVAQVKQALGTPTTTEERDLLHLADTLVRRSVWIIGGDGWAYDIGFGGLDQVIASGRNVNILVLDTEVYSNTGGQQSKSTPRAAVAKFASGGKPLSKKDLALIAMSYGGVYVARVAMGANDAHTIKTFLEAEAYDGPSIIIAYSHCIAHGYDLSKGMEQQALAVESGHWPLFRFNPALKQEGKNPFQLDSKAPTKRLKDYAYNETRYTMLAHADPEKAKHLLDLAQGDADERWRLYAHLADVYAPPAPPATEASATDGDSNNG